MRVLRYAITDRRLLAGEESTPQDTPIAQARRLVREGIDFLQLREKDLAPPELLTLALALRQVLPPLGPTRLILNGNLPVAIASQADGLHLPGGWTAADLDLARRAFLSAGAPAPILSVAAHTLEEVRRAREAGASLILFGPVFEKRVRGELITPGAGLERLAEAVLGAGSVPLLALGGVTEANSLACLDAGAAGVAAIRLFSGLPFNEVDGNSMRK